MPLTDWLDLIPVSLAALLVACLLYVVLWRMWPTAQPRPTQRNVPSQPVFLFDGDGLVDATPSAKQLIANKPDLMPALDAVCQMLRQDFPDLRSAYDSIADGESLQLTPLDGNPLMVTLENRNGNIRLALDAQDGNDIDVHYAAMARTAFGEELSTLRQLTNDAPQLIWCEDDQGRLLWANKRYLAYSDRCATDPEKSKQIWPGRRLFPDMPSPQEGRTTQQRVALQLHGEKSEHWFDVTSAPQDGHFAHYAINVNDVVRAENAKREFQQTLAKTFAQLSTGLAIFDKRRRLAMFNPSFLDMSGLPFEFLSSRPTIDSLMDRMRDMRRLPEPKDYASWREQFSHLEAEAQRGTYAENWNLPDGQTFRVTGRPHPDGALAFLFEDISAEISLTRHFRTEIETSHAVLDTLPEAIAVFSNANTLVITNQAYRALWGIDEEDVMLSLDLRAAMRTWKAASVPTPVWPRLESFAIATGSRTPWSDQITLVDGRQAICHAVPISGRMTMVKFAVTSPERSALKPLTIESETQKRAKG